MLHNQTFYLSLLTSSNTVLRNNTDDELSPNQQCTTLNHDCWLIYFCTSCITTFVIRLKRLFPGGLQASPQRQPQCDGVQWAQQACGVHLQRDLCDGQALFTDSYCFTSPIWILQCILSKHYLCFLTDLEVVVTQHLHQGYLHHHLCESHPQAVAWADSKRQVCVGVDVLLIQFAESVVEHVALKAGDATKECFSLVTELVFAFGSYLSGLNSSGSGQNSGSRCSA